MDIYQRKSRWKLFLALAGLAIMAISVLYTGYLAERLANGERTKARLFAQAFEMMNLRSNDEDVTFQSEIIKTNQDIPAILVNTEGDIEAAVNFGEDRDFDLDFLEKELVKMKKSSIEPIEIPDAYTLYYKQSRLLNLLTYFPILQFILLGTFILTGYYLFNSARRSEQNKVWVGMAKETAHQLGTPTSAIMAWIEHLRESKKDDAQVQQVLLELDKDVNRLDLIADRFSKIGSDPELEPVNLVDELEAIRAYMQRRAPRKVVFDFPDPDNSQPIVANINRHLFSWVLENLLRNALDAMSNEGKIAARLFQDNGNAVIEIQDSGKGIPSSRFKTVFQPGFTTKKRGWGLGLSLSKRIIESYHSGRIFVKSSTIDGGTTFSITIPSK
ncbi:MAG: HAMP domain-containing histidine kinase [Saprospiraceae bacterium]|nr:HAMP domain-containing histidine kinase [Saprospiraceae bacterium]